MLAAVLEVAGNEVAIVADGAGAVAAAGQGFDAILIDLNMPVMDGLEASAAIRRREKGRTRVPIIALTAGLAGDERARCLAAGIDEILPKPFDRGGLLAALGRLAPLR